MIWPREPSAPGQIRTGVTAATSAMLLSIPHVPAPASFSALPGPLA